MGSVEGVTHALVEAWEKKWLFEGRLDPLDRSARVDLIERINALVAAENGRKRAKRAANGKK